MNWAFAFWASKMSSVQAGLAKEVIKQSDRGLSGTASVVGMTDLIAAWSTEGWG